MGRLISSIADSFSVSAVYQPLIMKSKSVTDVISFRLDRKLISELKKQALSQRIPLSDYVRDLVFEALSQRDLFTEMAEMQILLEEMAGDLNELKHQVHDLYEVMVDS